jgi:ATP-binding cassette subfamily F protein 3
MIQFTKVSLAFGDRDILKNTSLYLSAGSRSCLAGANGSGKSTLMKVIAGELCPDSGERAIRRGCRISYLPQSVMAPREGSLQGRTLREEAETAYGEFAAMLNAMEDIGRALEQSGSDDRRTASLLEEYHRLQEGVENSGYYSRDQRISMVLSGLGFVKSDMTRRPEEFSGGWRMRIALAKTLLEAPDILLLDEPTNYLDIEARSWLEGWLQAFTGGYLLVSHDRYFLDVTVTEVYELFQGDLKRYAGNYTAYEKVRQTELDSLIKRYAAQQEEIAKAEDLIRRFRYKASKAAMVQERIKKLEKMDRQGQRIEIPESLKKISINFPLCPHSGRIALSLEGIGKSYGKRRVLSALDLVLESGERLLVVGRNGAGKSTLLRIVSGADRDFEGVLQYGAGIQPGYFSQDAAETLPDCGRASPSVLEYLEAEAPTELIPRARDLLGAFLFRGDDVYKPLPVLSGGEKSRLALLRMLLKPINLLILDEPTNHLDIYSKDILLDTLKKYTGTIIFVSHDRAFMEALSTKTLELSQPLRSRDEGPGETGTSRARLFYGDYAYYLDRLNREEAAPGPGKTDPAPPRQGARPSAGPPPPVRPPPAAAMPKAILIKAADIQAPGPASRREAEKQRRRLQRQEEEILKALEGLEAEKAALDGELERPEVYSDGEKAKAVQAKLRGLAAEIDRKTREWEEKAGELERNALFSSGGFPEKGGE